MLEAPQDSPPGLVFNVQRFSIHDGPGIRTTVFLRGCPADCWWCHNPEARGAVSEPSLEAVTCALCGKRLAVCEIATSTAAGGPALDNGASRQMCEQCARAHTRAPGTTICRRMTPAEVTAEILRDEIFYQESGGGVTFSGGEPLGQPRFLLSCLEAARACGIHRIVDTGGMASEETLLVVAKLTDLFLYDLKLMDEVRHKRYVGISNRRILANLESLARTGRAVWIRVPVIAGINDDEPNLDALARFVATLDRPYPVSLLPYHRIGADKYRRLGEPYRLERLETPSDQRLAEVADHLRNLNLDVRIGVGAIERQKASTLER